MNMENSSHDTSGKSVWLVICFCVAIVLSKGFFCFFHDWGPQNAHLGLSTGERYPGRVALCGV